MTKFNAFYNRHRDDDSIDFIGKFNDKKEAAEACYKKAYECGDTYGCDVFSDVVSALVDRNFYMVGYGPRELYIEEVEE